MSETCPTLEQRVEALEKNQTVLWNETFGGDTPYNVYFAADFGDASQASVLNLAAYLDLEYQEYPDRFLGFIAGGDLNYPSGSATTIDANLAPFQAIIDAELFFPALGNHDIDGAGNGSILTSRFPYLPNNGPNATTSKWRTYFLDFTEKIGTVFYILDTGYNTAGAYNGGATINEQKEWLYSEVVNLGAKFNIPVCHHPCFSVEDAAVLATDYYSTWDLEFPQHAIPIVLNGHAHIDSHVVMRDIAGDRFQTDFLNCSSFMNFAVSTGGVTGTPFLSTFEAMPWRETGAPSVIKMTFYRNMVAVSYIGIDVAGVQTLFSTKYGFIR